MMMMIFQMTKYNGMAWLLLYDIIQKIATETFLNAIFRILQMMVLSFGSKRYDPKW